MAIRTYWRAEKKERVLQRHVRNLRRHFPPEAFSILPKVKVARLILVSTLYRWHERRPWLSHGNAAFYALSSILTRTSQLNCLHDAKPWMGAAVSSSSGHLNPLTSSGLDGSLALYIFELITSSYHRYMLLFLYYSWVCDFSPRWLCRAVGWNTVRLHSLWMFSKVATRKSIFNR